MAFSERVTKAADLVKIAHEGQFRKDGKTPYFTHPFAVVELVKKYLGDSDEVQLIAALAHDCVEDVDEFDIDLFVAELYGDDDTFKMQKERVKEIVLALTKNDTLPNRHARDVDNWNRVRLHCCEDLKLCDRLHNVSDMAGMTNAFKMRYITETYYMLGCFEHRSNTAVYKDLLKLTEKRMTDLSSKLDAF